MSGTRAHDDTCDADRREPAVVNLEPRRFLDPRQPSAARERPIADAVNIPLDQLKQRTNELPPRDRTVQVAAEPELGAQTVALLESLGRRATLCPPRYVNQAAGGGRLWEPNAYLAAQVARWRPGRALDLACGTGREAVFLAAAGWQVLAVDVLPDALERGRELERRYLPQPAVTWQVADLEAGDFRPDGQWELITVFRFLHRPLLRRLGALLAPGGRLVCETFTTVHRRHRGRPSRDHHVLRPGELPELLADLEIEHYAEGWHGPAHTARITARRPLKHPSS